MDYPVGLRARLLLALERLFPPQVNPPMVGDEMSAEELRTPPQIYQRTIEDLGSIRNLDVLDFGCGFRHPALWLEEQRPRRVEACDIDPGAIRHGEQVAARFGLQRVHYRQSGLTTLPYGDAQFDVVISFNVFEHVIELESVLPELLRVLKPGGQLYARFSPLFYSPLGYHLGWATRVPYAHLLLGLEPIRQVRQVKRGPLACTSWEQTGLNRLTVRRFAQAVDTAGFQTLRFKPFAVRGMNRLAKLPVLQDLLTLGIECRLCRPIADAAGHDVPLRRAA